MSVNAFVGFDTQGDACIYVRLGDARYLDEPELERISEFLNAHLNSDAGADLIPDDAPAGDDVCDLCRAAGVNVDSTTPCGKTIGVECGCDEKSDGTCGDPGCADCSTVEEGE